MKKILAIVFILAFTFSGSAQTILSFCVEVEKNGICQNKSAEFTISKDGGTISFQLWNDHGIGARKVAYRIYKLEDNGTETYSGTIEQQTEKNWTYAWQDVVFYDEGTYKVKVFDTSGEESLLCSGFVTIFNQ